MTRTIMRRHPLAVRLWHWCTAVAVFGLLFTGLYIFNIHPRLYWGDVGNAFTPALASFEMPDATRSFIHLGSLSFETSGWLGTVLDLGADGKYVLVLPMPETWHFGGLRAWHFTLAWVLGLGWLAYLAWCLAHRGQARPPYKPVQRRAYRVIVALFLPLMMLTGLAMSNAITAQFHGLPLLFGGRQAARTIHAIGATLIAGFILVHLVQTVLTGFRRNMRAITTGDWIEP